LALVVGITWVVIEKGEGWRRKRRHLD